LKRVVVIGAQGFVGSAFVRLLSRPGIELVAVTRRNYASCAGPRSDVVIDVAGNSKKFLAEARPVEEFEPSVMHRLRTLHDFPADLHVHISSVDVYSDLSSPATTRESSPIDLAKVSNYGFHKILAEQLARHYAPRWLIARLAGMVGEGLRKNPVFDILNGHPLRIHPESQYQFMNTDDVATVVWRLVEAGTAGEIFNICGAGLISPREIAALAGRPLDLSQLPSDSSPRIVDASIEKIEGTALMPQTKETMAAFLRRR
jgi:nucleoside-diphosphate-sugar epimerase